jgi:hypothetical protein
MGATAPILLIQFQRPAACSVPPPGLSFENFRSRADDPGKRSIRELRICKKVQQGYPTFSKKSGKVTGLFKNCLAKSSNFLKIVHQSHWIFQKISGNVIDLFGKNVGLKHTFPHLILQVTLLDSPKNTRQNYQTFLKLSGKVIELFKNSSPKLPDFSKIARQSHRTF